MRQGAPAAPLEAEGPVVTLAEGARALGVAERRLRRLVARDRNADRTRTITRQTATGTRTSAAFSLGYLRSLLEEKESQINAVRNADGTRTERGPLTAFSPADLAEALQRAAVAEARVEMLAAERDRLSAALTREQETASKLADRLADADARLAAVLVRQLPPADTGAAQDAPAASPAPPSRAAENHPGEGTRRPRPWWFWPRR